ncbi:MAG: HPF/RaiA family ribosome-associated protein, partial [Acidovorax sp.]|nr:HPF/RaiA family ribosome-associated protein [Acidovorax sp.]
KGNDLFVESTHFDLYAAVDELMDKLDRMVVRHKDRLQDHQAGLRRATIQAAAAATA